MKLTKNIIALLVLLISTVGTMAQEVSLEVVKPSSAKSVVKPYKDVITSNAISKPGLFTIHKVDEKYFFEIPDSILQRELLLSNWLVKVPGGSPKYGGEVVSQQTIAFEMAKGNKIAVRMIRLIYAADSSNTIATAVKNANIDPVGMLLDIKARGTDNNSSVIEVTDLFQKDNIISDASSVKPMMGLSSLAAERSFIKSMNSYPINIEVKTTRTYAAAPIQARPGQLPPPVMEATKEAGAVTIELSTSILLMPKIPMQSRYFDPRVGYFADGHGVFSDNQQKVEENIFIDRYRLEPREEDMEKYKRGELVEPKQQIVYYTDPATPKKWRPYIIAGINDWNVAFEKAGFKNAIAGKEWPENDSTMSTEDARYKIVRYLPSDIANAYGPNIHDPRSGEILQSYVGWYHNIMKLLHDWYFVQAAAVDPKARKMKFDDDLMGKLIQFAVSHEIGHTLGLRHNMGSSSLTPVEKLRDKAWVEEHGHTVSIMDYARFNYVAQPEDSIGEKGIFPRIGEYDKWAIQWGYRYTGAKNQEEDKKIAAKWILDSLKANPRLWFGGEGRNLDSRCQTEDLGDNSMLASEYGIKNLKIVMANLLEWTCEENDTYTNLLEMYRQVMNQFFRYSVHVVNNVAGVNETLKSVEQAGDVYVPTPEAKQREAMAFLNREVFKTPYWALDKNIMGKLGNPSKITFVSAIQQRVLQVLFSDRVLFTLLKSAQRNTTSNTYTMEEFLGDFKKGIWSELTTNQPIDIYRRNLQKLYIDQAFKAIKQAEFSTNGLVGLFGGGAMIEELLPYTSHSDIPSYLMLHLKKIRSEALAASRLTKDASTREHLKYIATAINIGLDKMFTEPAKAN